MPGCGDDGRPGLATRATGRRHAGRAGLCADDVELMMACVSWHAAPLTERVRPGVGAWHGVSCNRGDGMGKTTLR